MEINTASVEAAAIAAAQDAEVATVKAAGIVRRGFAYVTSMISGMLGALSPQKWPKIAALWKSYPKASKVFAVALVLGTGYGALAYFHHVPSSREVADAAASLVSRDAVTHDELTGSSASLKASLAHTDEAVTKLATKVDGLSESVGQHAIELQAISLQLQSNPITTGSITAIDPPKLEKPVEPKKSPKHKASKPAPSWTDYLPQLP